MKIFKELIAETREVGKKSIIKNLLKNNLVPGVIYLKNGKNENIVLTSKDLIAICNDPSAMTRLYEVSLNGKKITCILKEVQFNPANDLPRSVDLMEVKSGDVVKVNIPIRVINKDVCPGIKNGGDVYLLTYNVNLRCKVDNIPYAVEVDVKDCDMGAKFFLSDIQLPADCKIINNVILLRIAGKRVIADKTEETVETAETTEATAAASTTTTTTPAATAEAGK